jgi:hypothetical protein
MFFSHRRMKDRRFVLKIQLMLLNLSIIIPVG